MNHNKKVFLTFFILLSILAMTGCATPQAVSNAQPCPTSAIQSCPTTAAQALPSMDDWRKLYNDEHVNVRITFDAGKKCSLDILKPATDAGLVFEIVVNDNTYQNYMVGTMTMDEGKTIKDLEEYNQTHLGKVAAPTFTELQSLDIIPPMSRTWHAMNMPVSPIYIVCFIEGPAPQTGIEELGPVEISQ